MITETSDVTTAMLKHALDVASLRHRTIANNIANANTEGYVPLEVSFERTLDAELRSARWRSGAAFPVMPRVEPANAGGGDDPGKVSLDLEVAKLSQNLVHYQTLLRTLEKRMAIIGLAISEGRR